MSLCGQFKKASETGGQVYMWSGPWTGGQPESFSMGGN